MDYIDECNDYNMKDLKQLMKRDEIRLMPMQHFTVQDAPFPMPKPIAYQGNYRQQYDRSRRIQPLHWPTIAFLAIVDLLVITSVFLSLYDG